MKILIGEDHLLVREGVEQIIRTLPEVDRVDEAASVDELMDRIQREVYDLVILDVSISGVSGLDALQRIRKNKDRPNVLLYSFDPHRKHAMFAMRKGAAGFLANNSVYDELVTAIRRIQRGGKYVSAETA
jgi:DNA-binding NarL/FixJ family response regulator